MTQYTPGSYPFIDGIKQQAQAYYEALWHQANVCLHFAPPTSVHPLMNKTDLIDRLARGTGLTKIETEAVVDGFCLLVRRALTAGESVDLRGFGSFQVQARAARVARNPRTNERIDLPAHYAPTFKPSRDLRDAVADALGEPSGA